MAERIFLSKDRCVGDGRADIGALAIAPGASDWQWMGWVFLVDEDLVANRLREDVWSWWTWEESRRRMIWLLLPQVDLVSD